MRGATPVPHPRGTAVGRGALGPVGGPCQLCPPPDRRRRGGPVTLVASATAGTSRAASADPARTSSKSGDGFLVHNKVAVHDNQGSGGGPGHDRGRWRIAAPASRGRLRRVGRGGGGGGGGGVGGG